MRPPHLSGRAEGRTGAGNTRQSLQQHRQESSCQQGPCARITSGPSSRTLITELTHQLHPRVGGKQINSLLSTSLKKPIRPGWEETSTGVCAWRTPNFHPHVGTRQTDRYLGHLLFRSNNSRLPYCTQNPAPPPLPQEAQTICHSETLRAGSMKNCNQRLRDPKNTRIRGPGRASLTSSRRQCLQLSLFLAIP